MSKIMIYATLSAIGGNIESVWGHQMRVKAIDTSEIEQAKADGWHTHPQAVIDEQEVMGLASENRIMKNTLDNAKYKERIAELEEQLATASAKIAELKNQLAVYETAKDANQDGVVSYDEMTTDELRVLLDQRKVSYKARDNKDTLVALAKDSEQSDDNQA